MFSPSMFSETEMELCLGPWQKKFYGDTKNITKDVTQLHPVFPNWRVGFASGKKPAYRYKKWKSQIGKGRKLEGSKVEQTTNNNSKAQ